MPEIHYYVVRQGDDAEERFVPVIPIDQMPDWLEIVGIPRTLHAGDAAKMTALLDIGRKGGAKGTFQARVLTDMPGEASPPASTTATNLITSSASQTSPTSPTSSAATLETPSPPTHAATDKEGGKRGNGTETGSSRATTTSNRETTGILEDTARRWVPAATTTKSPETGAVAKLASDSDVPSSAKSEDQDQDQDRDDKTDDTLPCKYWCRYGRCGFKSRCRFVHVMPLTREGLAFVDLDELPQWYVKKNTPAGSQSNRNSNSNRFRGSLGCNDLNKPYGGTLAARKKKLKIQKTTVISSSPYTTKRDGGWRCSPAPRETHMPKPTVPAADTAGDVEVGDLIDLI